MSQDKKNILILGSTIAKLIWVDQAKRLGDKGYRTLFFVRNKTSLGRDSSNLETVEIPSNPLLHWFRFFQILRSHRPHHIEAYHDLYRWDFLLSYWVYVFLARIFRIPIVSVCMGGEILYWEKHFFLKKWSVKALLRASRIIIVKEPYHRDYLQRYRVLGRKKIQLIDLPNATNIHDDFDVTRTKNVILYLNSFKSWRHPEVVIEAFKRIKKEVPDAELIMAGYRTEEELRGIEKRLDSTIHGAVRFMPYDLENRRYFPQAKVFLLPAELIYVNNALLEAMERAVPPIIGNVDPWCGKIVDDGLNGFVVEIKPEAFAEKAILLLKDEALRRRLGLEARKTVEERFNNDKRIETLLSMFETL
ncbi:MAG: glycosyltransferase family 4 protein [Acidobacteria bacterium]|nr:glycosyltransferase family 4 protein [Acidobacteriota bacterium]